jgi:hypothetical protein
LDFLPKPLRVVIAKALAPKADQRFPSCVAFIQQLYRAIEPLIEEDKRNNNWEGWLLEMEEAAGTKSPGILSDVGFSRVRWKRMPLTRKQVLPQSSTRGVSIRWFAVVANKVANKVESVFWFVVSQKRNPTIVDLLHLAAIVLMCLALVSIHQNWFARCRLNKDGDRQEDQAKDIAPHPVVVVE